METAREKVDCRRAPSCGRLQRHATLLFVAVALFLSAVFLQAEFSTGLSRPRAAGEGSMRMRWRVRGVLLEETVWGPASLAALREVPLQQPPLDTQPQLMQPQELQQAGLQQEQPREQQQQEGQQQQEQDQQRPPQNQIMVQMESQQQEQPSSQEQREEQHKEQQLPQQEEQQEQQQELQAPLQEAPLQQAEHQEQPSQQEQREEQHKEQQQEHEEQQLPQQEEQQEQQQELQPLQQEPPLQQAEHQEQPSQQEQREEQHKEQKQEHEEQQLPQQEEQQEPQQELQPLQQEPPLQQAEHQEQPSQQEQRDEQHKEQQQEHEEQQLLQQEEQQEPQQELQPPQQEPPLQQEEQQEQQQQGPCSDDGRRRRRSAVWEGGSPPELLAGGECEGMDHATPQQVSRLTEWFRGRGEAGRQFLELLPCDLHALLHGRTLWMIGDSQTHYLYRELSCFLRNFARKGEGGTPLLHSNALACVGVKRMGARGWVRPWNVTQAAALGFVEGEEDGGEAERGEWEGDEKGSPDGVDALDDESGEGDGEDSVGGRDDAGEGGEVEGGAGASRRTASSDVGARPWLPQLQALADANSRDRLCTVLASGGKLCHLRIHTGEGVPALLEELGTLGALAPSDVMLVNFGLWYARGKAHAAKGTDPVAYQRHVSDLAHYYLERRHRLPRLIWQSTSPQHFDTETGEFKGRDLTPPAGGPWSCQPIKDVALQADGTLTGIGSRAEYLQRGGWRNQRARPVIEGMGLRWLDVWNETVPLHYLHRDGECTHFKSGGGYAVWVWLLWRELQDLSQGAGS